ncbi:legume-like lectin family-domain-containing protein [Zopfochytrium polystomum]|nr:legume-like lectin family-domain-containing protein [Zopfochytrium polystomum]
MVGLSSISGVALAFLAAIISGIHARMFEGTAAGSALKVEHSEIARRFDYRLSVKKPFFFHNDPDMLPYYETSGHVLKSPDQLRLTSSLPNQRGAVWSKSSNPHKEWQIHFSFNVFGRAITGGEGLAIWYAKDKSVEGPVYGSMDKWHWCV